MSERGRHRAARDVGDWICEELIRRYSPRVAGLLYWLVGQALAAALVGMVWGCIALGFGRLSAWVLLGGGIAWAMSGAALLVSGAVLTEVARSMASHDPSRDH